MRRIIALSALSLSLLGGIAAADRYQEPARRPEIREHRSEARALRDFRHRPALRFERAGRARRGFEWISGQWSWYGGQWNWVPGHYIRARFGR